MVGIGRRTGFRWRAENGGLPPFALAEDLVGSVLVAPGTAAHRRSGAAGPAFVITFGDRWPAAETY